MIDMRAYVAHHFPNGIVVLAVVVAGCLVYRACNLETTYIAPLLNSDNYDLEMGVIGDAHSE